MAVMVVSQFEGEGFTQEMYDRIAEQVLDQIVSAKGFVAHFGGPLDNGWEVTEVWETKQDQEAWFNDVIAPKLPADGPRPKDMVLDVHNYRLKK
jgi:hypothetical protein